MVPFKIHSFVKICYEWCQNCWNHHKKNNSKLLPLLRNEAKFYLSVWVTLKVKTCVTNHLKVENITTFHNTICGHCLTNDHSLTYSRLFFICLKTTMLASHRNLFSLTQSLMFYHKKCQYIRNVPQNRPLLLVPFTCLSSEIMQLTLLKYVLFTFICTQVSYVRMDCII